MNAEKSLLEQALRNVSQFITADADFALSISEDLSSSNAKQSEGAEELDIGKSPRYVFDYHLKNPHIVNKLKYRTKEKCF